MANNIFSPEELAARRQFHELFCSKYLYTGAKKGALNEDSWNAEILWDILRNIHEDTPLTPDDIEAMLQVGGMYDSNHELYFHYHDDTPMVATILYAMSPYITTGAFVAGNQRIQGRTLNNVATFFSACCCNPNMEVKKYSCNQIYDYYVEWCTFNGMLVISARAFAKRMRDCGAPPKKGYFEKKSGVMYYVLQFDESGVRKIAKQKRTPEEAKAELECVEQVRDVNGTRTKIHLEALEGEESNVYADEEGQIVIPGCFRDVDDTDEDDAIAPEDDVFTEDESAFDEDGFNWENGEVESSFDRTVAAAAEDVEGEKLSAEVKRCFKLLKITYRVSPEHFTREDFDQALSDAGLESTNELYARFIEYVK